MTRAAARLLVVVALVLVVAGCRVETTVGIDVGHDGSGHIEVAVGLDDDALAKIPDLKEQLQVSDLTVTGWKVTGPTKGDAGLHWVRADHSFATPAEATKLLRQLSGDKGPFRSFRLTRHHSFLRTKFAMTGTVDFTGGLESFSDPALTQQLGGQAFGRDLQKLEQQLGQSLDRTFRFKVAVRLPGKVSSNAPVQAGNGAIWQPALSDPRPAQLTARSSQWNTQPVLWTVVAVVAGVILLLWLLVRLAMRATGRQASR
jgi:hypothetical protein